MNLENYNIGAGLNKKVYVELIKILDSLDKKQTIRILEFGSGMSTKFFIDYNNLHKSNTEITSFDNDLNWCYKQKPEDTCLNLHIRPLITCDESDFNAQIKNKTFNRDSFSAVNTGPAWRQRNCFYDIQEDDIKGEYDIIVIDGPSGNGRNISYFHFMKNVKPGTIVLIDDHNASDGAFNYDFIDHFNHFFNAEEVHRYESPLLGNFQDGGNFVLLRIKS